MQRRRYPHKPTSVYLFGTCLIDLLYPQAGMDAISLLEREGLDVIFPQGQTCCSQPAYNSGYDEEARVVARQQLSLFPGDQPIVVPSGSCAGMLRHHYLDLFAGQPELERVQQFADRVFELTEFLVQVLHVQLVDKGDPLTVALHTSCSARREMGVADDHRALLQQLQYVELVTQERETECCGFGGTFAVKAADISAAMVNDKCDAIVASGCEQLVSGDCGCLLNIGGAQEYRKDAIQHQHLASFLWKRTQ